MLTVKQLTYFESEDGQIFENQEDCLLWESAKARIEIAGSWLMRVCDEEEGIPTEVAELSLNADFDPEDLASLLGIAWPSSNAPKAIKNLKAVQSLSNWILKETSAGR